MAPDSRSWQLPERSQYLGVVRLIEGGTTNKHFDRKEWQDPESLENCAQRWMQGSLEMEGCWADDDGGSVEK